MARDPTTTDEWAVRALAARFADALSSRDGDRWEQTWTEDATWVLGAGRAVIGRAEIRDAWERTMSRHPVVVQLLHQGEVHVSGDTATARWYLSERGHTVDGDPLDQIATYDDECVRTSDGWRFVRRQLTVVVVGTSAVTESATNPT